MVTQNTIRFPDGMYTRIGELASEDGKSVSAQVLSLLDEALQAHGGYQRDVPKPRTREARGGAPPKLNAAQLAVAQQMLDSGSEFDEVAAHFRVHKNTLWRHIGPAGRASVLTEDQAREIKRRLTPKPGETRGESGAALAREFGVSEPAISAIKTGRAWRNVAAEPAEDAGK